MPESDERIQQFYEPIEIAALIKVDVKTVRRWLRDPSHPLVGVKFGNTWRVSRGNLGNFLQDGQ